MRMHLANVNQITCIAAAPGARLAQCSSVRVRLQEMPLKESQQHSKRLFSRRNRAALLPSYKAMGRQVPGV